MLQIFISAPEEEIRPGATGKAIHGYEAKIVREFARAYGIDNIAIVCYLY